MMALKTNIRYVFVINMNLSKTSKYYKKYILYKTKYINLAGGVLLPPTEDINKIVIKELFEYKLENQGQHNCGILMYKNYLFK